MAMMMMMMKALASSTTTAIRCCCSSSSSYNHGYRGFLRMKKPHRSSGSTFISSCSSIITASRIVLPTATTTSATSTTTRTVTVTISSSTNSNVVVDKNHNNHNQIRTSHESPLTTKSNTKYHLLGSIPSKQHHQHQQRSFLSTTSNNNNHSATISNTPFEFTSESHYHSVADETLEQILDAVEALPWPDENALEELNVASGVLTITLLPHGTWVINKQTPNRQLWWSSPLSGPRRYEYNGHDWIYTRAATTTTTTATPDGHDQSTKQDVTLGDTLAKEIYQLYGLKLNL